MRGRQNLTLLHGLQRARLRGQDSSQHFDAVVRLSSTKARHRLLRAEAIRQDELSQVMFEGQLARGELWAPPAGSALEREWLAIRADLVRRGEIEDRQVRP